MLASFLIVVMEFAFLTSSNLLLWRFDSLKILCMNELEKKKR